MTKYARLIAITILLGMMIPANAYAETTASTLSLSKDKPTIRTGTPNQRTDSAPSKQPAATVNVSKQLMMLGLGQDALRQAIQNGKSLGEYASDQGIQPDQLTRAMTLEMENQLHEQVQHHQLSTEQTAKLQQHMTQRIQRLIDAKRQQP
ncbi:hypothetical protein MH117_13760 [Paenibacillus sp. ACRRX]|uniref:hypothetical protein n=1 Tax=unclassified Paenibacillus TaxID=185978 RepID=UPI001EF5BB47|nr:MULTISPECIES: hypothetical protein [unclassified Paenibacillus]MCG7408492.1 hypothetical protein [Paenibacillus sp. ACRRX]MDK8182730.1 hypothetical protein [Paenibacillus sp. UMB4589-SE434]